MARGMHLSKGPAIKMTAVAGGTAGDFTVTGITTSDVLLGVSGVDLGGTSVVNLLSEFSITATNKINNTAGTDTTGYGLIVLWEDVDA